MATKVIQTTLSMRDQFSAPAKKIAGNVKNINREVKRTQNKLKKMGSNAMELAKKTVKAGTIMAGALGGLALKTGFSEAFNMEGYKTQLETATKDTKKAGEIMAWSVGLANKTPFETGSVVEMSAKFEAMGMSAKKWGGITADMAGATNKDVIQATEAIIDAQTGELERLKEFGITKAKIADKANKMFAGQQIVNNKGQITDQAKFNEALMKLMEEKYKGGADKLAGTAKGLWSTVTGITKNSLSTIVGIQQDGTVRQGSLYEQLKGKLKSVADTLLKWQQDGTITKISSQVTSAVNKIIPVVQGVLSSAVGVYNFVSNNWSTIVPVVMTVVVAMTIYKGIMITSAIYTGVFALKEAYKNSVLVVSATRTGIVTAAQWAWNAAMSANPIGLVIGLIAGLVAGVIIAYNKFEKFRKVVDKAWNGLKNLLGLNGKKVKVDTEVNQRTTKTETKKKGFARGGIATRASIFGEAGPEMAIPLKRNKRSLDLLKQTGRILGVDKSTKNANTTNSIKQVFNTVKNIKNQNPQNFREKIYNTSNSVSNANDYSTSNQYNRNVSNSKDSNTSSSVSNDDNRRITVNVHFDGVTVGEKEWFEKAGQYIAGKVGLTLGNVT